MLARENSRKQGRQHRHNAARRSVSFSGLAMAVGLPKSRFPRFVRGWKSCCGKDGVLFGTRRRDATSKPFEWLEKGYEDRSSYMEFLKVDAFFEPTSLGPALPGPAASHEPSAIADIDPKRRRQS
jgi:hypothetical protein